MKAKVEREAYHRHVYEEAEILYILAHTYGFNMDKATFHQSMESPTNAEIFLNNLFEAGILDEKKDILLWINLLYKEIPLELKHLDLGKGIDTVTKGQDSDTLDDVLDLTI
ncbi:MAG: hypothetical protein NC324_10155 [Bacteroides sp.]|nr:hypothetical protein [Bacteroides sp.]